MTETDRTIDYEAPEPPARPAVAPPGYYVSLYKPEYAETASRLVAVGFTEDDVAYALGVPKAAITNWKANLPEFKTVYKDGKRDQLKRMAAKAMLEAVGYDYETKRVETTRDADGNIKSTKEIVFNNHQSPQPNMLLFLMCNLSSQLKLDDEDAWKSRQKMEIESKSINLTVTGELVSSQIQKLAGKLLGQPEAAPLVIEASFEPKTTVD